MHTAEQEKNYVLALGRHARARYGKRRLAAQIETLQTQWHSLESEEVIAGREVSTFGWPLREHDEGREGGWVPTFTGRRLWPLCPRPEDIDPLDIARGLSRECRFGGHITREHYSVAQHSVLVACKLPSRLKLHGLLHDAPEGLYLKDFTTPIKALLGEVYTRLEESFMEAVSLRFRLTWNEEAIRLVKEVDARMAHTEALVMTTPGALVGMGVRDALPYDDVEIPHLLPSQAESLWLDHLEMYLDEQ